MAARRRKMTRNTRNPYAGPGPAPRRAEQGPEAVIWGLVVVSTEQGPMVDPAALERVLAGLHPILGALPTEDQEMTESVQHWLAQVARIRDAVGALNRMFTAAGIPAAAGDQGGAHLVTATVTRTGDIDEADVDQVEPQ